MEKKHLTLQDRQNIEQMLNTGKTFAEIALALDKNKSTISREVRARSFPVRVGAIGVGYNACKNRYGCKKTRICGTCNSLKKFKVCRRCSMCNLRCSEKGFHPEKTGCVLSRIRFLVFDSVNYSLGASKVMVPLPKVIESVF